jgi:Bacterial Ig domain/Divergent InlB B-repeat domain
LQLSKQGYLAANASVNAMPPFPGLVDVALISANQVILEGTVTDRGTGQPIAGAKIDVYGGTLATVHTDANGHYSITGNQYPFTSGQVFVSAAGYYSAQNRSFSNAPSVIDVPLLPGGPVLRGTVRDEATGAPVAGVNVVYGGSNTFQFGTSTRFTTTNALGEYVFDSAEFVEAAASQGTQGGLQLSKQGYLAANASVNAMPPFPGLVDVALISANQVILEGTVTDRGTGQPIAGAKIDVYGGTLATVHTDANGHYSITGNQYAHTSGQVWVSAAGYYSAQNRSFSNAPSVIDFTLLPGEPVLRGTVRDEATGLPIAGAHVAYNGSNTFNFGTTVRSTTTDLTGHYVLDSSEFAEATASSGTQGTISVSAPSGYFGRSASVAASAPFPHVTDLALVPTGATVDVTVQTNVAGTTFEVDGSAHTSAQTFEWVPGNPHAIGTTVEQAGPTGTRYVFLQWSDSGAPAHTIVAPQTATTYTATFETQYLLTTMPAPVVGGSVQTGGWHNAGTNVSLTATPSAGYEFAGFSGDLTGTANPQTVTMNGSKTVTANFVVSNRAPTAVSDSYTINEDTTLTISAPGVLANDSDPDGDALSAILVSGTSHGTLTLNADGSFVYTPASNYSGPDSFSYKVNDGSLDSSAVTVSLTITSAPLAVAVVAPNGGERVFASIPTPIQWTVSGASSVDVELSRNGGTSYAAIAGCTGLAGTTTSCTWTPTGPGTSNARIRVTARASGGTNVSDTSDANFTISASAPSITVTSPNTAVAWAAASARSITWNHNLGLGSSVRLELSRDNGGTWETIAPSIQNTTATSGTYPWVVSSPTTSAARVRVTSVDTPATDIGNSAFSIVAPAVTVTAPNTNVNWVIGSSRNVTWTHNLGTAESVRIELSRDGGSTWEIVSPSVQNTANTSGSFDWVVTGPVTAAARMRVAWAQNTAVADISNVAFRIGSSITVTAPNTAETWGAGSTRTVTWNHSYGASQTFDLAFSPDAGASWMPLASGVPAATGTTGTYTGPMPNTLTTQALIRVSPAGNAGDGDVSNVTFSLAVPIISVTAPNTNVAWPVGASRSIRWTHNLGQAEQVNIEVSRDGGNTWTTIASGVTNSADGSGVFSWTVSGPATTTARIRVTWTADGAVQDVSNVNFRIQ